MSLVDNSEMENFARRVVGLMMAAPDGRLFINELVEKYQQKFNANITEEDLRKLVDYGEYIHVSALFFSCALSYVSGKYCRKNKVVPK